MKLKIKNGELCGFYDEIEQIKKFMSFQNISTNRVSHIYPVNFFLRVFFIFLRKVFGEKGKIAQWTRRWNCKWTIYIPRAGYYGIFTDRNNAIKIEKEIIWDLIKQQKIKI